ncbi:MAG: PQQ-binding-like beta-propeller repeat protein [Kofleriaceae bacterium]|nr:PQQ-binding-like beta-propeller repeat protein [Kofleriaceae bacterium]
MTPGRTLRGLLVAVAIAVGIVGGAGAAAARTLTGTVFADADGDGVLDAGERGVATVVAWEGGGFVRSDDRGAVTLTIPDDAGLVWARVPAGYRPGPAWRAVPAGADDVELDLPLTPAPRAAGPLTFVVAADTHLHADQRPYGVDELRAAIVDATALAPTPRFFTILGDVSHANAPEELAQVDAAMADLDVPWVPVAGNHDWYDGGEAWRAHFGPAGYSFDVDDVHVVVIDTNLPEDDLIAFLDHDLAYVDPGATIVALGHAPQSARVIASMEARGVDLYLAGHWHASRVVDHGALVELDTEPFLMGGMDGTPAGYRVITIAGATIEVDHHAVVRAPQLALVAPLPGRCARPGEPLVVAAEVDARPLTVTARIADRALPLRAAGGWDHVGAVPAVAPGTWAVRLEARGRGGGAPVVRDAVIDVCDATTAAPAAVTIGSWPQLGGGAARGAAPRPARSRRRWSSAGRPRWAARSAASWSAAASCWSPSTISGAATAAAWSRARRRRRPRALALDLAGAGARGGRLRRRARRRPGGRGAERRHRGRAGRRRRRAARRRALSAGLDPTVATVWASPVIDGDTVWGGGQRRFAALALVDGAPRWSLDPVPDGAWHATLSSPAVAGDLVVATFERGRGGLQAWSRAGAPRWRVAPEAVIATSAAPVLDGATVYVATGMGDAVAIDATTGAVRWTKPLTDDHHEWAYAILGTPALAQLSDDRTFLIVPTMHDHLWALDAASGDARWSWTAPEAAIYPTHYRGRARAVAAAPVVTGAIVWAAATDGTVVALDAATGAELHRLEVGAPVLAGLAAAGDLLVVGGWDGTVHAFASGTPIVHAGAPRPVAPPGGGRRTPVVELAAAALILVRLAQRALAAARR